ncbi:MAG TPA: hypothetical protein VFN88_08505 [Caulobacteraceae bacterium]|jgi:hypothetical protein|nr:hypothetical protein [Caulobacteraceae bacterium]
MDRRLFITLLAFAPSAALAKEGEEKKKGGGANYIQIPVLTATITRADGRRGVLTVETGVDIPDKKLRELADASTPRLRAAYANVVMTYGASLSAGSVPNADYLSRELQRQTDLVLGRPGARLLLGTILVN